MTTVSDSLGAPLLGRRERKKRATKLALRATALDLVGERGYAHVTVEDIADAVDVAVRTFFNYFPSKEAAIVGDDPELIAAMRAELLALPPQLSPLEALRSVLVARIHTIGEDVDLSGEDHRVWLRRFAVVRSEPEVLVAYIKHLTVVEGVLTEALVERLGNDEGQRAYAALVAAGAMGVMRVAGTYWGGEGGTAALVGFADAAFDLLGRGLTLTPGDAATSERLSGFVDLPARTEREAVS